MSESTSQPRYGVIPDGRLAGPVPTKQGGTFRELQADLWSVPKDSPGRTLRLITTNGATRKDGSAIMGRGCAREARDRFPGLDFKLGRLLREHGNRPMRLMRLPDGSDLASFPVKHTWRERADLDLIEASARLLLELVETFSYDTTLLPRPGCGNGGRRWHEVRARLAPILDERFVVVNL